MPITKIMALWGGGGILKVKEDLKVVLLNSMQRQVVGVGWGDPGSSVCPIVVCMAVVIAVI